MRKSILVIISVILLASLTSCDFVSVFEEIIVDQPSPEELFVHGGKSESEYVGVYLTLEGAEYIDGTWRLEVRWHNETNYDVIYGAAYTIEYEDDGEWTDVTVGDVEFIEIAYSLGAHSVSGEIYTTKNFDVSREGKYRIKTEFNISDASYNGSRVIAIEFSLTEESQETLPPIDISTEKLTWEVDITDDKENSEEPFVPKGPFWLFVHGKEYLYEPLEQRYDPGATVTVKIQKDLGVEGSNTGILAVVDGNTADISFDPTGEYQFFTFTMPRHDVKLYLRVYSVRLLDSLNFPNADNFIRSFWSENPHLPDVKLKRYYGEDYGENQEGIPVVLVGTGEEYEGYGYSYRVDTVAGNEFKYEDMDRIFVAYDKFYTLPDAYKAGILSDEDIARIAALHNSEDGE